MDLRMISDHDFKIKANEILQVAQRFQKRGAMHHSNDTINLMAASSSNSRGNSNSNTNSKVKQPTNSIPLNQQSESWARLQTKKMGLPAIDDPRKNNPNYVLKKSAVVSHPCIAELEVDTEEPFVSSVQTTGGNEPLVLLDSGATHHVTGDINLFTNYRKVDLSLSVASAKRHLVVGKGTISLECQSGRVMLTEVLHCPEIPGTIISLGKFMRNDGHVIFENNTFKLKQNNCTYNSLIQCDRWYLLLSHHLARMQRFNCVKGLPTTSVTCDINLCRSCSLAKSKHLPLATDSRGIVTLPGDVIVADLMGPFPVSFDKAIYALIIQDHFSSLATFYPLKQKSDAASFILEWIKKFNNLTKWRVKRLRTDNGGEFSSCFLNDALRTRGIVHETTIPYKHHQAGKIERSNRTIAEAARSMLIDSNLGPELWTYAFRQAVWVLNRVLHGKVTKTPYEWVTDKKPDLTPLRVFGCKAYFHNCEP
ncbi:hypothetical protein O181_077577 [Austropuccinia psidii MF-1]|uniref:Integrase catalytic domain-containing protein n=1 Tax=Austropuccinia psidii MF-1 TaxID=1389203 RepID=A0A9Q3FG78_9BASI|nr:hypothetical protein [Austropuccinia psidii MF-1]